MKKFDLLLLIGILSLIFFGLFMIYDISSFVAFRDFGDKYYYIREQIVWASLGLAGLTFFSFFDYRKLFLFALPALIVSIIFLILVFVPRIGVYTLGAHRWVNFRFFVLQPAEFLKFALAIYLSAWFSQKEKGRLLAFFLLIGFVLFLVLMEPDMGTAFIILFEGLVIYFLSGDSLTYLFLSLPFIGALGYLLIKLEPYRAKRLNTFFNYHQSIQDASYHVRQILISLGSGGIFGVGLGNSLQKYAYLPENTTDSIFAIIAEELGFIGAVVLITIFMVIVWRGFVISSRARDKFGKLLSAGIISFLGIQAITNLAAQTAFLPLTGIPLPFISYGGSSLVVDLCSVGILLNISKQGGAS